MGARVPLTGSLLPFLRSARRLSRLDGGRSLPVVVSLRLRDPLGLQRFLQDVYDPRSPLYHHYLTPSQFAARFGASSQTQQRVSGWLRANGLQVVKSFHNGLGIVAHGDVRHLEGAFSTRLYNYRQGKHRFFANAVRLQVPRGLAPAILSVSGLTSTIQERPAGGLVAAPQRETPMGYSPQDLARIYDVAPLQGPSQNGAGQTIAVVAHSDFSDADLAAYGDQFGISGPIERVPVDDGTGPGVGLTDDQDEVEMDLELAHSLAPGARILAYEGSNSSAGAIAIYNQIVSDRRAQIVTTSFGDYERDRTASELHALDTALQEAAAQGQTVFAASGDEGAYDEAGTPDGDPNALAVDFPASDPWVTGVGGTILEPNAEGSYGTEIAWSDSSDPSGPVGTGGGLSRVFTRPDYQSGPGVNNQYSNGMRQVPDVAAMADSPSAGYAIYTVRHSVAGWLQAGGTSASAPLWASFTAVLNQHLGRPVGFLNPTLYAVGRQAGAPSQQPFHDITTGTNLYYSATPGWDFATGWGSFDGAGLAGAVAAQLALAPSPTAAATPTPTTVPPSTPTPKPTATATPRPRSTASIPLRAALARSSIHRGGQETLTVDTAGNAAVSMQVQYPGGLKFQTHGKSDARGRWRVTWTVRTARAGRATLTLVVTRGKTTRRYTLHFTIT